MSVRRLVRTAASAGAVVALAALASLPALAQSPVTDIGPLIVGDGLPSPLADGPADVRRGRAIVTDPLRGNCTICHVVPGESERFQGLTRAVRMTRYGGDCYGYCLLAAGHIDVIVETGLKGFDVVALIPIIEKAGGCITTWTGGSAHDGGRIVATGDPALHEIVLKRLGG